MFTIISHLTGRSLKEVELVEPEEIRRNEYRHVYGDGSEVWCPVFDSEEEAWDSVD